jgi:hypothetical protein
MKDLALAASALAIAVLLALAVFQNYQRQHKPQITTPYQRVTLVNGEVHYGRIAHLGTDHPVLRDAFSVRTEPDPQTGQPRQVLVPRRDGATGADHLIMPATSILTVEPVQPDSAIGRLIGQHKPRR